MLTLILPTNLEPSGQRHPSSNRSERLLNSYNFHKNWWFSKLPISYTISFAGGMPSTKDEGKQLVIIMVLSMCGKGKRVSGTTDVLIANLALLMLFLKAKKIQTKHGS